MSVLHFSDPAKETEIIKKLCEIVHESFVSSEGKLKQLWDTAKEKDGKGYQGTFDVTIYTGELICKYVDLVIFPDVIIFQLQVRLSSSQQSRGSGKKL